MLPIDLGSSGSCTIGGVLATNAGGIRVVRYGSLRANLLGLEVVLADGSVLDMLSSVRKDNTGYDLKQMFVGSEGTLGFITAACLATPPRPASQNLVLFGCSSYDQVVETLRLARQHLGEILSAAEMWDLASMALVLDTYGSKIPDPRKSMDRDAAFYLLVETAGSNQNHDMAKIADLSEDLLGAGVDGLIAQDSTQAADLWAIRESITLALKAKHGHTYKFDVSLPVSLIERSIDTVRDALWKRGLVQAELFKYGHICEGGLHLNVWSPEYDHAIKSVVEDTIYHFCCENRGSISAEHGIGTYKKHSLAKTKQPEQLDLMRRLKQMLDPNGILNPDCIF
jgi:FAD/FMN-containing dehydrogenase